MSSRTSRCQRVPRTEKSGEKSGPASHAVTRAPMAAPSLLDKLTAPPVPAPPRVVLSEEEVAGAGITAAEPLAFVLNGLLGALGGASKNDVQARATMALGLLTELAPANALESLLVSQMLATHHVALTMLERATFPNQPSDIADRITARAVRLQRLFVEQTAALAKLRGQGAQMVRVIHEHRHAHIHADAPAATRSTLEALAEAVTAGQAGGAAHANEALPHAPCEKPR